MELAQSRLKTILESLSTTANAFAKKHSMNANTLYGFLNGDRSPGYDTLVTMCASEPRISAEYLLRGEGEPLRDKKRSTDLTTVEQLKEFKADMIQALDKRIQELGG